MKSHYYIPSTDSAQQVHYVVWQGAEKPRAVLQLVHGMEEYIDRYDLFAEHLVSLGWAVIGHDHLGHGQSGIHERGHFSDDPQGASILIEDIHKITKVAKKLWPNLPLCIMGHSMGSFLTRRYLCEYSQEVRAAIIMGSGWYSPMETGAALLAAKITCFFRGQHTKSKLLTAICSLPFLFAFREEGKNAWLDVVTGIFAAINYLQLERSNILCKIFNIGSGKPISLCELIGELEDAFECQTTWQNLPMQSGDMQHTLADISCAKEELGYQPVWSLHDGIRQFVSWYKSSENPL